MVKNSTGGNKNKNIGSKFAKKSLESEDPDFENSFFAEITTKPNGLIANVKVLPHKNQELQWLCEKPLQVNIGKLKNDKRSNFLVVGDIVQVEINFDMNRQNGNLFSVILCKYSSNDVRNFKKQGLIPKDQSENQEPEEDIFGSEDVNLETL